MRFPVAAFLLTAPAWASAQPCPAPIQASELQATLDAAEGAYARVDVEAFRRAVAMSREQLPCMNESLPPAMAAQVHRLEGLSAFIDNAREKAVVAFAAARSVEPNYQFPTSIVPPGNPVLDQYLAREPVSETESVRAPKHATLRVNGGDVKERPVEFPVLVQVVDAEGQPGLTAYLWPDDALPFQQGPRSDPLKTGLLIGGVGLAAAGGVLSVLSATTGPEGSANLNEGFAAAAANNTYAGVGGALLGLGAAGIGVSFVLPTPGR